MNKKILILFTAVFFIFVTNLFLIKSSAYKKIRNNHLLFTGIHKAGVIFTVKQHCISPGQPYATPDGNQAGSVSQWRVFDTILGINIRAGRHGTKETVNCIIANMLGKNASFANKFTFDSYKNHGKPKKLNFAVKGTLVINSEYFDNIILAQGHNNDSRNIWWFGGSQCNKFSTGKEQVNCTARDGTTWCFVRGATDGNTAENGPDHIKVEAHGCISETRAPAGSGDLALQ